MRVGAEKLDRRGSTKPLSAQPGPCFSKKDMSGTSMEEIAAKAGVSKQTVYKHFADKQQLFTEIILATTSEIDRVVALVAGTLVETRALKTDLRHLGREFMALLMDPQLLRLRRLVIANADRMPELGRAWYERGFERVLAMLATCFVGLIKRGLLHAEEPLDRGPPLCRVAALDSGQSGDVHGQRTAL